MIKFQKIFNSFLRTSSQMKAYQLQFLILRQKIKFEKNVNFEVLSKKNLWRRCLFCFRFFTNIYVPFWQMMCQRKFSEKLNYYEIKNRLTQAAGNLRPDIYKFLDVLFFYENENSKSFPSWVLNAQVFINVWTLKL